MKNDKIAKLDFSDEFLLDAAERRFQSGDYLAALTLINKRNGMYDPSADCSALAADIYEAMGLYPLAADCWFRFLDTCNEADFAEGYEGLAVAFMNMNNEIQSAYYYRKSLQEDGEAPEYDLSVFEQEERKPKLRLIHSNDGTHGDPEALTRGLSLLKTGDLDGAKEAFSQLPAASPDYPSAAGLSAMCTLMSGDEEGAEKECEELLARYPDNVQALTTYCAVLGARDNKEGAKEVARKLASLQADATDDLYRIATALCETGLDEEAREKLSLLKQRLPYDDNVLYFHAVAAYRTGRIGEAIDSLDRLTTIYPRKAVARYYLIRLRSLEEEKNDGLVMTYYYRMPEAEYRTVADFLLKANDSEAAEQLAGLTEIEELFRLAFDEMEGRDDKLQMLAARVAVRCRCDSFVREALLDCEGDEIVKISVLHDLTMRNEDNSFGTVICNLYKEFFTHEIDIGSRKREEFMKAFADVYSKFALLGEENEAKICAAAEDIYRSLEEAGAWTYFDERTSLAAAIYRESRMRGGERSFEKIVKLFDANKTVTQRILNYMI